MPKVREQHNFSVQTFLMIALYLKVIINFLILNYKIKKIFFSKAQNLSKLVLLNT
jgi:hypothetical protein